jgi:hypothetical protein
MDAQAALARLFRAQGLDDAAQRHSDQAHALAHAIEMSLVSSDLEAQLRLPGDSRWRGAAGCGRRIGCEFTSVSARGRLAGYASARPIRIRCTSLVPS